MELETIDTAELCLRVIETRSRWQQEAEFEVRGEALFVPAFSITMQSDLSLPLSKDGRVCGMIRLTISRDGWELYFSDPNKEALVEQVSPMFDPKASAKVDSVLRAMSTPAVAATTASTAAEPEQTIFYAREDGGKPKPSSAHAHTPRGRSSSPQPSRDKSWKEQFMPQQNTAAMFATHVPQPQNVPLPPPVAHNEPLPPPAGITGAAASVTGTANGHASQASGPNVTPPQGLGGGPGGMLGSGQNAAAGAGGMTPLQGLGGGPGGMMSAPMRDGTSQMM
jgi:hypothetical protein